MPTFSPPLALLFIMLLAITVLASPVEIAQRTLSNISSGGSPSNCSSVDLGPPTECGQIGNTVIICSPNATDTWTNDGTPHAIVWNSRHPLLAVVSAVDIYLISQQNYKDNFVRAWPNQPSDPRLLASHITVCVDSSWFPPNLTTPLSDSSNRTFHNFAIRIVPVVPDDQKSDSNSSAVTPGLYATSESFTVSYIAPSLSPSPSLLSSSPSSSSSPTSSTSLSSYATTPFVNTLSTSPTQPNSSNLASWQIGLIAISGFAVVIAIAAAGFTYTLRRSFKHRKTAVGSASASSIITSSKFDRPHFPQNTPPSPSITSTAPLVNSFENQQGFKVGSQDSEDSKILTKTLSNTAPPATPALLSTTDAKMIAETFRRKLRRPEWDEGEGIMNEEERRETGERLLREELAEEGTDLRSVQKRATVGDKGVFRIESQKGAE